MTHRRPRSGKTWHCCRSCTHWPEADFEETWVEPAVGLVCSECLSILWSDDILLERDGTWARLAGRRAG